jgi:hypothetical protein
VGLPVIAVTFPRASMTTTRTDSERDRGDGTRNRDDNQLGSAGGDAIVCKPPRDRLGSDLQVRR